MRLKVTLDTNVLISGFLFGGACEDILRLGSNRQIQVFTSKPIVDEFREKLETKLRRKYHINSTIIEYSIAVYLGFSDIVVVSSTPRKSYTVDKMDNLVIDTALVSNSSYLITGDRKHLLKAAVPSLNIIAPADFLELFRALDPV